MSDNNSSSMSASGLFLGLLQIVFITLKLCKVINWSWWCVLIPGFVAAGWYLIVVIIAIAIAVHD